MALLAGGLADQPLRRRAAVGGALGAVLFVVTLRWATIFTLPGDALLTFVQTLFPAAAGAAVPSRRGALVALPGALVLTELLRRRWPLSGLPLSGLDISQARGPLRSWAGWGGPLAVVHPTAASSTLLRSFGPKDRTEGP